MLVTDLYTDAIPYIYRRFAAEIGDNYWRRRVAQCKQDIKGNEFLRDSLLDENAIAFQLERLHAFGNTPIPVDVARTLYPAASFAAQVLSLIDACPRDYAEGLRGRVRGAFQNPADMRGFLLELTSATHFIKRGYRVSWPEMTGIGIGTFDLLVEGIGPNGLEVECKSISEEKGCKIHRRGVLEFYVLLKPRLKDILSSLTTGRSVTLTLPGRFPPGYKERLALADDLASAIAAGESTTLPDGSHVRISAFNVLDLSDVSGPPRELRSAIDGITETDNRHTMVIGTRAGGAIALAVQSAQDDGLMKAIFATLRDAAKRQFSRTRPGLLFAGFHGIDAEALKTVAEQDADPSQPPTTLRVALSDFLSSSGRDHVVGVGFLSRSGLRPAQHGTLDTGGLTYYFPKVESPFWSSDFNNLFDQW